MKKIITLLAGCSLALAGAVIAQQPEGQESPAKKGAGKEKTTQATEAKPTRTAAPGEKKGNPTNTEKPATTETTPKQHGAKGGYGAKSQPTTNAESSPAPGATNAAEATGGKKGGHGRNAKEKATAETGLSASPSASQPMMEQGKKGRQGKGAKAANATSPSPAASAAASPKAAAATSA